MNCLAVKDGDTLTEFFHVDLCVHVTRSYQKTLLLVFATVISLTLIACAPEGNEVWVTPWSNYEAENRDVSRSEDSTGTADTSGLDIADTSGLDINEEAGSDAVVTDPDVASEDTLADVLLDNDAVFDAITDSDTVFDLQTDIHMPDTSIDDADPECPLDRSGITYQMSRLEPAGVPQRIIIESVNFENDSLVIRNVSDVDVVFERDPAQDNSPWRVGAGNGPNRTALPEGFSISAGHRVRIHLAAAGTNDSANIYLEWTNLAADLVPDVVEGSEVAVLSPYG